MAKEYIIEIGGDTFSGVTASAQAQMEALHVAMRTGIVAAVKEGHSDMGLVTALGGVSWDDLKRLQDLVVKDCITRDSDDVPVAVNLFRDNVQDYYLLIMKALQENLAGFWQLRRQTGAQGAEQTS